MRPNLAKTEQPWASILQATPDVLGAPGAGAVRPDPGVGRTPELPSTLVEQLRDGGRLVIPVAGTMLLVIRSGDEVSVTEHGHYRFVPLR